MRIDLDIDELVLDGIDSDERSRIRAAVESELVRLISSEGDLQPLQQGGEVGYLDGGVFEESSGATGEAVGSRVARALYGALRR